MKFLSNLFPVLFLSVILFSTCRKEEVHQIIQEPRTILDTSYGGDVAQKADIYLPAGRSSGTTRVLLIIHGGGWFGGDKKDMQRFVPAFQAQLKNYAIINMNYRLVTFVPVRYMLPTQTDDIRAVMDFVKNNAAAFGVKPEFVVLGLSAGGHLAMLYSYKYDSERRVKGVVNIVGPSDLSDNFYQNNTIYRIGMGYITHPDNLPSGMVANVFGSPANWISSASQPTISFYGTNDGYIPESQHTILETTLNRFNVYNEKHIYNGGHEVGFGNIDDIVSKTAAFLRARVK